MPARMKNPAAVLPGAWQGVKALMQATREGGVPQLTLELVHLRVSQINGCSACVDAASRAARKEGATDEQVNTTAAWRDAPFFTDAERAALALAETATRLADREDAVPDPIWDDAANHYDEKGLAAIVLMISVANLFNRLNETTRQQAGNSW